jgi:hypothetical protein
MVILCTLFCCVCCLIILLLLLLRYSQVLYLWWEFALILVTWAHAWYFRIIDWDEVVNKSDSELTDPAILFRQQCRLDRWVILCSIRLVGGLWTAVCYFEWKQGEWTVPVSILLFNWTIWVFQFCMGMVYNSGKDFGLIWRFEQIILRTNWSCHFISTAVSTGL